MTRSAAQRFEAMAVHPRPLPAVAWTGISIRLEIEAKPLTGGRAAKLRDRAEEARGRADRARAAVAR